MLLSYSFDELIRLVMGVRLHFLVMLASRRKKRKEKKREGGPAAAALKVGGKGPALFNSITRAAYSLFFAA